MGTSLVVTVIGNDRPGIVGRLSEVVLAAGANWEESRMARLAGKFAGILRISVAAPNADALASGLRALTSDGLTIVVESSGEAPAETFRTVRLELVGNDHPGIIRDTELGQELDALLIRLAHGVGAAQADGGHRSGQGQSSSSRCRSFQ